MIGLSRIHPLPIFTTSEIRLLEQYVGHLVRAFRIGHHLAVQQMEAMAGRGLLMASRRPIALLENDGRLAMANAAAESLFSREGPLYVEGETLRCRRARDQVAMTRALKDLDIDDKAAQVERPRRLALKLGADHPDSERLLCSFWCMRPELTMGVFGSRPVALLTIATRTATASVDPVFLASMFDLTPAECRLSMRLVEGKSLHEIAHMHRVALDTLKAQLKSVFVKTGTHRQAEFAALLLRVAAE
jgi:DNA-binding CsgD family transcriptional regulator